MKIMVADDDPVIRLFVQSGLSLLGHEVIACESGDQAWSMLKDSPAPLLITDWAMPGLDGLQLTQLVRRLPRGSYTYVIMLTGRGSREDYLTSVKAGVDAFIVKPVDGAVLEAQVSIAARILGLEAHAKRLEAIMTVCAYCKKVRDKADWMPMEEYVADKFKALPSHTYCPTCFKERVEPQMRELGISTDGMDGR